MKPLPKTLQAFLANFPAMFEQGHSEQDDWNGAGTWAHWVYLKPGYCYPEPGAHIIHEPTVREVKQAWRLVAKCSCEDCRQELGR